MAEPLSRDAVIAAARDLIKSDGLAAVSLRRVGASLEVTAPALYAYVSDKQDLLQAIAEQEFATLRRRFEAVEATDPVERTRGYCRAYVDQARAEPELFKTMFLFPPDIGLGTAPGNARSAAATETFDLPAAALAEGIEAGLYHQTDPLLAAFTMWSAMHGLSEVLLMGFDLDDGFVDQLVDTLIDTLVRGL